MERRLLVAVQRLHAGLLSADRRASSPAPSPSPADRPARRAVVTARVERRGKRGAVGALKPSRVLATARKLASPLARPLPASATVCTQVNFPFPVRRICHMGACAPSPLAGEGVGRRPTDEGGAARRVVSIGAIRGNLCSISLGTPTNAEAMRLAARPLSRPAPPATFPRKVGLSHMSYRLD